MYSFCNWKCIFIVKWSANIIILGCRKSPDAFWQQIMLVHFWKYQIHWHLYSFYVIWQLTVLTSLIKTKADTYQRKVYCRQFDSLKESLLFWWRIELLHQLFLGPVRMQSTFCWDHFHLRIIFLCISSTPPVFPAIRIQSYVFIYSVSVSSFSTSTSCILYYL